MDHPAERTTQRNGMGGRVETIHIARAEGAPVEPLQRVHARTGIGLEGDRNERRPDADPLEDRAGKDLTLVEAEAIEAVLIDGIRLAPGEIRRNLMTRGIRLNELVGRRFRVGEVECYGVSLCEPCAYLAGLVGQPLIKPLTHRAGLRADILSDGEIAVGDEVIALDA